MSSTLHPPPPAREQLCKRYCSNKHTHSSGTRGASTAPRTIWRCGTSRRVSDSVADLLGVRHGEPTGSKEPGAPRSQGLQVQTSFKSVQSLSFSVPPGREVRTSRMDVNVLPLVDHCPSPSVGFTSRGQRPLRLDLRALSAGTQDRGRGGRWGSVLTPGAPPRPFRTHCSRLGPGYALCSAPILEF
jgi:hypothetical protein